MFDCVMPTRNGRNALAFTDRGTLRLRNAVHQNDPRPLEENCPCPACRHSRAYLRHLFMAEELLAYRLASQHNIRFLVRLMERARAAILAGEFDTFAATFLARYRPTNEQTRLEQRVKWDARKTAPSPGNGARDSEQEVARAGVPVPPRGERLEDQAP
jgi:queuine/archaeosine tRNA-ribosyltransferase